MDRRKNVEQNTYKKELDEAQGKGKEYDDKIIIEGKQFRIPYKMVKEVTFSDVSEEELTDLGHAGRLQYKLLLLDSVLKAQVDFEEQKITIVYNPLEANNRKEKTSLQQLVEFLGKEGVQVATNPKEERDLDYVTEIYSYFFNPSQIRERPPYGYTMEQWEKMKDKYNKKTKVGRQKSRERFKRWQEEYAEKHPGMQADTIKDKNTKSPTS